MSFVYPAFLFGLFSLLIPILIHLFNFRRYKRVAFSNVRFLREVKEQTKAKSELKHVLVLISRLLALAFLVLAFAQPFLKGETQTSNAGQHAISIYLDNSFSMNAVGEEGDLFEVGRQYANNIVEAFDQGDEFQFLTNSFSGEQQRLYNREGIVSVIEQAEQTPEFRDLNTIITRQVEALSNANADNKRLFLISDRQEQVFQSLPEQVDSTIQITLVELNAAPVNNLYIDSCWFTTPVRRVGQTDELMVRVKNAGQEALMAVPLKLFINNQQKSVASVSIQPGESQEIPLSFAQTETGQIKGRIEIADYPVTFDDTYYFQYTIAATSTVLHIYGADSSKALRNLFSTDDFFQFVQTPLQSLDYSVAEQADFIILSDVNAIPSALLLNLNRAVDNGSSLLFFPAAKSQRTEESNVNMLGLPQFREWTERKAEVATLAFDHPLYQSVFEEKQENIDLPKATQFYQISTTSQVGIIPLMQLSGGAVFLGESTGKNGGLFFCASPLSDSASTFQRHALFVPTLFQMALRANQGGPLAYTIGKAEQIKVKAPNKGVDEVVHLVSDNGKIDIIPEVKRIGGQLRLRFYDQLEEAGNYRLTSGTEAFSGVAWNYSRKESELQYLSMEEVLDKLNKGGIQNISVMDSSLERVTGSLKTATAGTPLWQFCLLLAFAFFVIEILLLRLLP